MTSNFRWKVEICPYRARAMKGMQRNPYLMAESSKFTRIRKSGLRNTMMTSEFRPEVKYGHIGTRNKNMKYYLHLTAESPKFTRP